MPTRPSTLSNSLLARTPWGAVQRCPCCGNLDVRFDGVALTLAPDDLRRMRATVIAMQAEAAQPGVVWNWLLRADTPRQSAALPLDADGVSALADLLDEAVAALDLDAFLLDVLGPRPAASPLPR